MLHLAPKKLMLGKYLAWCFEGKVGVKMKGSWKKGVLKEEETEEKVKIPSGREILEVEEGPGDQKAAWE